MAKWSWPSASTVLLSAVLPFMSAMAQSDSIPQEPEWLLNTLKEALVVADGDVLSLRHTLGDVRIKTAETDRIQVTAIAQYNKDDPRVPSIRFTKLAEDSVTSTHQLVIDFAFLEIAEQDAWDGRRIDVGLLVPKGLQLQIETEDGLIEAKDIEAKSDFKSVRGDVIYEGINDLKAYSKRGSIRAHLHKTGKPHIVELATLTGDVRCILLEGANADVELSTRGPITTDYTMEVDRKAGSPLKLGRVRVGEHGSKVRLESHSGGIRLQGLIVPEKA